MQEEGSLLLRVLQNGQEPVPDLWLTARTMGSPFLSFDTFGFDGGRQEATAQTWV